MEFALSGLLLGNISSMNFCHLVSSLRGTSVNAIWEAKGSSRIKGTKWSWPLQIGVEECRLSFGLVAPPLKPCTLGVESLSHSLHALLVWLEPNS